MKSLRTVQACSEIFSSVVYSFFLNVLGPKKWKTRELPQDKEVADYEIFDDKEKTEGSGVQVSFKEEVVIQSFEFRSHPVKFKIN